MSEDITSAQMDALQESGGDMTDLRRTLEDHVELLALLALLDQRDAYQQRAELAEDWVMQSQRRVAALEEAYKRLASQRHSLSEQPVHMEHIFRECPHPDCLAARALLDPAPSEPGVQGLLEYMADPAALPAEVGDRFDVVDADDGHLAIRVSEATDE